MKARHCLFHVECFRCTQCDLTLRKGDLFGMFDEVLYCKAHFEQFTTSNNGGGGGGGMTPGASLPQHTPPEMGGDPTSMYLPPPNGFPPPPPGAPGYFGDPWFPPPPPGGDYPGSGMHGGGDFPYDNNNEPMLKKRRGRKKRKVPAENFPAMNGYLDGSGFPGGPGCLDGSQSKTKRARTSFKHHQLRIMKAHFQINQNPDSRELKMLSQKTGLDKKVLQVCKKKSFAPPPENSFSRYIT